MAKNDVVTGLRAIGVGSTKKVDTSRRAYGRATMDKQEQGVSQDENYKSFVKRLTPKK